MPTSVRYLLFQIPGWIIAAGALAGLVHWELFPPWLSLLCFSGWVLKDLILYPITRTAYERGNKTGSEALVGTRGVAEGNLAPEGYVRIRGELWRAVTNPEDHGIASGTEVEVLSATHMKVLVRPVIADQNR
jgi:membrane protein implicated in regulation of membrane protease activity